MQTFFGFKTKEACLGKLAELKLDHFHDAPFCPPVWDTVLCWPAARVNTNVTQSCPPLPGLLRERKAFRFCGPDGLWGSKDRGQYTNGTGFTNYTECYSTEAWNYYVKYMSNKTDEEKELMKDIIAMSRTLEIVGLSISLVTTVISLVIFCYFRSLKCHRTRIHKNLFVAMIVQIAMRIILYVDQLVARETGGQVAGASSGGSNTIYDTPVFCEVLYSLLEYTKTVKFMWMFIEGVYLHNMIAVSVFSGKPNYVVFYLLGWGFPVLVTVAWVIPMSLIYETRCWFAYYMNKLIWIIEGPRAAVMAVNLFFLLNIIRVLVMKLRETQTNEADKLRKAVKAAIVLLPLLGITNFVIMLEPDGREPLAFGVYSFFTSFLNASEGFFISLLYCFLNGEVRQTCRRHWQRYRQTRLLGGGARYSLSHSLVTSVTEVPSCAPVPIQKNKSNWTGPSNGEALQTRFVSMIKGSKHSKKRSCHELGTMCRTTRTDAVDLPDIVTCRTDLMCEDHV